MSRFKLELESQPAFYAHSCAYTWAGEMEDQLQEQQGKQPRVEATTDGRSDHDGEAEQLPTAKRLKEPGEEVTVKNKSTMPAKAKLEAEEDIFERKERAKGKKAVSWAQDILAEGKEAVTEEKPSSQDKPELTVDKLRAKKASMRSASSRQYWLIKSEPESRLQKGVDMKFSIEDLQNEPEQTTCWDGVRNRHENTFMRDDMGCGDLAFFYHSNCKDPGIAGESDIN